MTFREYLQTQNHYTERSLQLKEEHIFNWKKLCSVYQKLENLDSQSLLKIIEIQKKQYETQTLNNQLKTLDQYFQYLVETNQRESHPIKGFRIKTKANPLIINYLTKEELENIYENQTTKGHHGKQFDTYKERDKAMVGLMVYQALNTGSLAQLKTEDLDLENGKIKVPQTTDFKLNERVLNLESNQILFLQYYLTETRPKLLQLIKTQINTDKLFPTAEKTRFRRLVKQLKKRDHLKDINQIRYSRINLWLKQYNIREVQYKAGYKSLASIEKFNQSDLESLKQAIEKYHPMQ
jgi:site-specific recombinase XerD